MTEYFKYFIKYHDKLFAALSEHMELVIITLIISVLLAAALTVICNYSKRFSRLLVNVFSMIYSIPSLAMFALLIPVTGLGQRTAITVLVIYNQYLLLRNFLAGLENTDPAIVEAAAGMGMTRLQILIKIKLPLSRRAIVSGIRIAAVSTVGIATIAASINAGGLGAILFDGLRTMNTEKIIWGSILSAALAVLIDWLLSIYEKRRVKYDIQNNDR